MSIRIAALYLFVAGLSVYAWKDWFKSLCGLILLMAVIEHEDMPKAMLGIQGLNMWNVLFAVIFVAWLASRRREGLQWDMPRHVSVLLLLYLGVVVIGFLRAVLDRSYIQDYPLKDMISEELINTIKWVLPGVLVFSGCRTRKRLISVIFCLLVMTLLIGVQVARRLPAASVLGDVDIMQTRNICEDIGFGACTMSTLLAALSWSILGALPLVRSRYRVLMVFAAVFAVYAQALTGGRAGYVAWGMTGLILCLLKWRKQLILVPILAMLLPLLVPGAVDRLLMGSDGVTDVDGENIMDIETVSSGRFLIWPYVIKKISQSPVIGYGRLGMRRSGLQQHIGEQTGDFDFPHPHNMYLETLLDNGIAGSIPIFMFWGIVVVYANRLFRSDNRLCAAAGCFGLSYTLTQLIAGLGSQHVYAEEDTMVVWVAMFITIRVYVESTRAHINAPSVIEAWDNLHRKQLTTSAVDAQVTVVS